MHLKIHMLRGRPPQQDASYEQIPAPFSKTARQFLVANFLPSAGLDVSYRLKTVMAIHNISLCF